MIYKKSSQGCSSSWLWSAPTDGVGLVSCDVFLVGELVLVFWLMELDLVSLKGSEVSSSRFWGVCEFSISLGNPSGFGSVQSVQFSHLVVSNSLQPHEPQHVRPPCLSPTPRVHPNPCPSSWWCHPTISSSVIPFSSCPLSFPASGSFPMSQC